MREPVPGASCNARRWRFTPFECQQCGECCSVIGQVLFISRDCGDGRYILTNRYTGEKTLVEVAPDQAALFGDRTTTERYPEACPFLRFRREDEKAFCAVHLTRPDMCRDFGCWRLLILKPDGSRAGRVMGRSHFCPDDADLARIWEDQVRDIEEPGDESWIRTVTSLLTLAGYIVRQ
ncbi:MAG: YkgJ family cysteine cluster protein [Methanomicrobiales archaeon]|nr:YkgJ family cysteine cluster protein [Methanomicrobiales archaeon]